MIKMDTVVVVYNFDTITMTIHAIIVSILLESRSKLITIKPF